MLTADFGPHDFFLVCFQENSVWHVFSLLASGYLNWQIWWNFFPMKLELLSHWKSYFCWLPIPYDLLVVKLLRWCLNFTCTLYSSISQMNHPCIRDGCPRATAVEQFSQTMPRSTAFLFLASPFMPREMTKGNWEWSQKWTSFAILSENMLLCFMTGSRMFPKQYVL